MGFCLVKHARIETSRTGVTGVQLRSSHQHSFAYGATLGWMQQISHMDSSPASMRETLNSLILPPGLHTQATLDTTSIKADKLDVMMIFFKARVNFKPLSLFSVLLHKGQRKTDGNRSFFKAVKHMIEYVVQWFF